MSQVQRGAKGRERGMRQVDASGTVHGLASIAGIWPHMRLAMGVRKQSPLALPTAVLGLLLLLFAAAGSAYSGTSFDAEGARNLLLSFFSSAEQGDQVRLQPEQLRKQAKQLATQQQQAKEAVPEAPRPQQLEAKAQQQRELPEPPRTKQETKSKQQRLQQTQPPKKQATEAARHAQAQPAKKRQWCAVYNNVGYHMDVAAGLAWAFQEAGCNVTFFLEKAMRGLQVVNEEWYRGTYRSPDSLLGELPQYDVVVFVTFPEGFDKMPTQMQLVAAAAQLVHQRQLLIIHNPDLLIKLPFISAALLQHAVAQQPPARMQPAALAPFVANYTHSLLQTWAQRRGGMATPRVDVPWLLPLVPAKALDGGVPTGKLRHLCIQGTIDPMRRDYTAAFAAASHPAVLAQLRRRNESLLLVGGVRHDAPRLAVPTPLQAHVQTMSNLNYKEYYARLARCRALLTAFPVTDVYLVNKSSSTVAAAIHVGTPLVTEERVIAAYSYLRRNAVFAYDTPPGAPDRDPAALAAAAAHARAAAAEAEAEAAASKAQQQQSAHRQRSRRLAEEEQEEEEEDSKDETVEQPEPGSYAAALLRTFDPGAATAAHRAVRSLKAELMRHNAEVAAEFLLGAAAKAVAAPAAVAQ